MNLQSTNTPGLYTAKGSVFDYKSAGADGIEAFVKKGFNNFSTEFMIAEKELEKVPFPVKVFGYYPEQPYRYLLENHASKEAALQYIREMIPSVLDRMVAIGSRKILFHGIRILGIEDSETEAVSCEALRQWASQNQGRFDQLILASPDDFFSKHF